MALSAAAVLIAAMMVQLGLGMSGMSSTGLSLAAGGGLVLLRRPHWGHRLSRAVEGAELLALFGGMALAGELASYCVAAHTAGYVDLDLAAADRALGFDWLAAYRLFHDSPMLRALGRTAYFSLFLSPTLLLVGLTADGRIDHARRFLAAYAVALTVTVTMFAWFPAVSAGHHYLLGDSFDRTVVVANHIEVIDGLRAGTFGTIPLGDLRGLITFPSFHAASGLLFIWGCWPLRGLRWPLTAMNLAMIAATPVVGSHYLVDVIGGLLLAAVSIALVRAMACQRPAATASTTLPTWSPASR